MITKITIQKEDFENMEAIGTIIQTLLSDDNTNSVCVIDNHSQLFNKRQTIGTCESVGYINGPVSMWKYFEPGLHIIKNSLTKIPKEHQELIDSIIRFDKAMNRTEENYILYQSVDV